MLWALVSQITMDQPSVGKIQFKSLCGYTKLKSHIPTSAFPIAYQCVFFKYCVNKKVQQLWCIIGFGNTSKESNSYCYISRYYNLKPCTQKVPSNFKLLEIPTLHHSRQNLCMEILRGKHYWDGKSTPAASNLHNSKFKVQKCSKFKKCILKQIHKDDLRDGVLLQKWNY